MKRITLILLIIVSSQLSIVNCLKAQQTSEPSFLENLQQVTDGKGKVRIFQDSEIATLLMKGVNQIKRWMTTPNGARTKSQDSLSVTTDSLLLTPGRKVRMNGYRVQIYAGGNSRDAKNHAYQMEAMARRLFPDQPVYTRFVSPRWICHVGDFRTREEALELLKDMRQTGKFSEAIIVKCKVNLVLHDE